MIFMSNNIVNCPNCGSEVKEGMKFCEKCGNSITPQIQRYCNICGAKLMEDAKFCNACGGKVENENKASSESQQVHSTGINVSGNQQGANDVVQNAGNGKPSNEKPNRSDISKQTKITIIISGAVAAVVITVLLIVVTVGLFTKRPPKNTYTDDNNIINYTYETTYETTYEVTTTTQVLIPVVDVTNMEYPDAVKALTDAGFTNITSDVQISSDDERWVVVYQSIPAGEEIVADNVINLDCVKRCYLYLDITSDYNLIFSTYAITVLLDGTSLGSVDNGDVMTYLADVECGEHTISFCKADDSSINQSKTLMVSEDTTYTCKLTHGSSSISIINEDIQNNIDKASLEVIDVTDMPLSDAKIKLKNIGFTNITTDPKDIIAESGWIVTSQSIDPGICIDKNDSIQLGCINGDKYFAYYIGKNPNECDKMAEGSWYKITYRKDSFTTYDLSLLSERGKEDYFVSSVSYLGVSKELNLYLTYTGPTPIPTATPTPRPTSNTTRTTTAPTTKTVDYSTNDYETAKDGNTGVYAYKRSGTNYDQYLIIDFDEGFIYYFCEGNGDETCDKMKIDSGDLNSLLYFYFVDGDDVALYAVNFAWQRRPEHLIFQDDDGFDWDYYTTNLTKALELRDSKEIYDYY